MGKYDLKVDSKSASSSKKRKLSDVEYHSVIDDAAAITPKKAKKHKSSKKEMKYRKEKKQKKGSKEAKAAETAALNGEYDVDDQAIANEEPMASEAAEELSHKEMKVKMEKKEKNKNKKDKGSVKDTVAVNDETVNKSDNKAKKAVKKKKTSSGDLQEGATGIVGDADVGKQEDGQQSKKKNRFICFVGNLPFSATKADIQAHFAALHPISVRLLTQRDEPTKSRGIAFIEFANNSQMETCLAKMHHTEFPDPTGSSSSGGGAVRPSRRINVELTAGGGGNTSARRDKVKSKNAKLNEERARRVAKEAEEEEVKKMAVATGGGTKESVAAVNPHEDACVHPSRRAYVREWRG